MQTQSAPAGTWLTYDEYRRDTEHTVVGHMRVWPDLWSTQLHNMRDILVLLPPSYPYSERRYPVLYMHDGQNLFDQHTSFSNEWRVDETVIDLSRERIEGIIVGVPNAGKARLAEYTPFPDEQHGGGRGDAYLRFLMETVKPLIDGAFRTRPEPASTGLIGSSLGGLISLYGFFRYPDVFGLAGAMSSSLWFAKRAMFDFIKQAPYNPGRLYIDTGTHEYHDFQRDRVLFRIYSRRHCARTRRLVSQLRRRGYSRTQLCYQEDKGAIHNESAWANRLPAALRFLIGPYDSSQMSEQGDAS